MTDDRPLVLTVPEVAAALRISRNSAYEAIRRGEIRALRFGRTLRVPAAEVERLLACRVGSDSVVEAQRPEDVVREQRQ